MRVLPTALLFTSVTEWLFQTLDSVGERACRTALQRYYFIRLTAEVARSRFFIQSWVGDGTFVWTADWWAGVARMQPGSTGGSQAQESWHRHKLQSIINSLHLDVDAFANKLARVTKVRYAQLRLSSTKLPDVPQEPYPDNYLLDGHCLTSRGRTGAYQFQDTLAFRSYADVDGTQYYGMRRTLGTYDEAHKVWTATPNAEVERPPPHIVARMVGLFKATTADALEAALVLAGVPSPMADNMNPLYRLLAGKVLVVLGPHAAQYWRRPEEVVNSYCQSVCMNCVVFATHGTCEHVHAALLDLKALGRRVAEQPARTNQGMQAEPTSPAPILVPGRPHVPSVASTPRRSYAPETPLCDRRVGRLLDQCGLGHLREAFRLEGVTLEDLSSDTATPQWLKAYFPMIQAGPARRLLEMARGHHQDSPEDGHPTSRFHVPLDEAGPLEMPHVDEPLVQSDEEGFVQEPTVAGDALLGDERGAPEQLEQQESCSSTGPGWWWNPWKGVAHPTNDGKTLSCGHSKNPGWLFRTTDGGLEVCPVQVTPRKKRREA